jgi:hypothetical protein
MQAQEIPPLPADEEDDLAGVATTLEEFATDEGSGHGTDAPDSTEDDGAERGNAWERAPRRVGRSSR